MFPTIRCQNQFPNEFQQPESLCLTRNKHLSLLYFLGQPFHPSFSSNFSYLPPVLPALCALRILSALLNSQRYYILTNPYTSGQYLIKRRRSKFAHDLQVWIFVLHFELIRPKFEPDWKNLILDIFQWSLAFRSFTKNLKGNP